MAACLCKDLESHSFDLLPWEQAYGQVLSSTSGGDLYGTCRAMGELVEVPKSCLPSWDLQYGAVLRMIRRHKSLLDDDGAAGLLIDTARLLQIRGSDPVEHFKGLNRLIDLVQAAYG